MKEKKKELPQPETKPANFTHRAVGTLRDPLTAQYHLIEIPYDPKTLEVGEVVKKPIEPADRGTAIEQFKILAASALDIWNTPD